MSNATLSGIGEIDILQITVHDPQAEYKVFEYLILISFHQEHICQKVDTRRMWEKLTENQNPSKQLYSNEIQTQLNLNGEITNDFRATRHPHRPDSQSPFPRSGATCCYVFSSRECDKAW